MRESRIATLALLLLFGFVLTGCALTQSEHPSSMTETVESPGAAGETQDSQSEDCPLTTPIVATPPDSEFRDPLPHGAYFVSTDELIWAEVEQWRIGSQKVRWIKPLGSQLVVQGRRLDGDAAPLWASIGDGYAGDFQASWLIIPSGGCWEVEARASGSFLRFVLYVPPRPEPMASPACAQIGDIVRTDRTIFVGQVESKSLDPSGRWAWLIVRVKQDLFPYSLNSRAASAGAVFTILQDGDREPLLVEGVDYVLVIHGDPWRIVCPHQTVATVDYAQEPAGIVPAMPEESFWSGETVSEIKSQIRLVHNR